MLFQESVREVDESNYEEILKNKFVVLQFFSDWKMNCLMTLPLVEDLAREFCERNPELCFGRVNIDEFEELAEKHGISKVPTIIILRDKEIIDKIDNSFEENFLRERLEALF
jgi:thioredoxin 1